jgi:hypothetical protein
MGSILRQTDASRTLGSLLPIYVVAGNRASPRAPFLEQNSRLARSLADKGGRDGSEPDRRKLEQVKDAEAAVGKTD